MIIQGNRVVIRETSKEDLENLVSLWNNGRVMKWVGFPKGLNCDINKTKNWFNKLQKNTDRHHYSVYTKEKEYCGEVYYEIDKKHKRAGLDIKFRPEVQGKGLATDALKTLIDFIFKEESDIDTVWTEPSKENIAAKKLYEHCGLEPKNRPKDIKQSDNSYWELTK